MKFVLTEVTFAFTALPCPRRQQSELILLLLITRRPEVDSLLMSLKASGKYEILAVVIPGTPGD